MRIDSIAPADLNMGDRLLSRGGQHCATVIGDPVMDPRTGVVSVIVKSPGSSARHIIRFNDGATTHIAAPRALTR